MLRHLRPAFLLLFALTLLTGGVYPLAVTALAQALFPVRAAGSLLVRDGRVVGSSLIGQSFASPRCFWSRPSATSPLPYNAGLSSGSNLGPTNPVLGDLVARRVAALRASDPSNGMPIPVDLVTASASGLDPHISPAAALWQVPRIARVRGIPPARVRAMVEACTEERALGCLGEPRVNVLRLNLALDGRE